MTREEAIARIENHKIVHKMDEPRAIYISEALDMAIKALEQQPCTNIPFLLHKEFGCPLNECVKAYEKAIEYLRSKAKIKG